MTGRHAVPDVVFRRWRRGTGFDEVVVWRWTCGQCPTEKTYRRGTGFDEVVVWRWTCGQCPTEKTYRRGTWTSLPDSMASFQLHYQSNSST